MTDLIPRLRNERYREAREKIWHRFGEALIRRARFVLRDLPNSCGNGEEAAISAFMRFTEKAKAGELNKWPTDSKSLQMLLLRAARDRARDMKRQSLKVKDREWGQTDLAQVSIRDDVDAHLIEEELIEYLRATLPEKEFEAGMLRAAGTPYAEIAAIGGVGERTIERRLASVRNCLEAYLQDLRDAE